MRTAVPFSALQKASIAIVMTWAAGFIDVIGYLTLYSLYTAHMSGNTVEMGRNLVHLNWYELARGGWTVAAFMFGLIAGAFAFDAEKRGALRLPFPATLSMESILLVSFIAMAIGGDLKAHVPPQPAWKFYALAGFLAVAMGLQNVTIRRVGGLNVYTTFITGSLVKFGEAITQYLFWVRDRLRWRFRSRITRIVRISRRNRDLKRAVLTGSLWASYFVGAVAGAFGLNQFKLLAMIAPTVVVIAVSIYGGIRPFVQLREEEW